MLPRQGQRPVNDDLLAQRRRHNIRQSREGGETALGQEMPNRLKKQLLAYQRDSAAKDDPPRTEQENNMPDRDRKSGCGIAQDPKGFRLSILGKLGDQACINPQSPPPRGRFRGKSPR